MSEHDLYEEMTSKKIREDMEEFFNLFEKNFQKPGNVVRVSDPVRIQQLKNAYKTLKQIVKGQKVIVTYEVYDDPLQNVGIITIEGKDIFFKNSELFLNAIKYASNIDVYPNLNGKVKMDIAFYGVTKIIK